MGYGWGVTRNACRRRRWIPRVTRDRLGVGSRLGSLGPVTPASGDAVGGCHMGMLGLLNLHLRCVELYVDHDWPPGARKVVTELVTALREMVSGEGRRRLEVDEDDATAPRVLVYLGTSGSAPTVLLARPPCTSCGGRGLVGMGPGVKGVTACTCQRSRRG